MTPIHVEPNRSFYVLTIVVALVTFGIGFLMMWNMAREWPELVDDEGITNRNGDRFAWNDLKDVIVKRVEQTESGEEVLKRLDLVFSSGTVAVTPGFIEPANEVLAHLRERLGDQML